MPVDEDSSEEDEWEEELPAERAAASAAAARPARAAPDPLGEELLDAPGEEDILQAAGAAVRGAWRLGGEGLRRRGPLGGAAAGAAPRPAGGLGLDDDDGGGLLLGSERLDGPPPRGPPGPWREESVALWRQAFFLVLVVAGLVGAARDRRPERDSFEALLDLRYGGGANRSEGSGKAPWPVLMDRSFQGRVAWSRYVDHGAFALGTVALSVAAESAGRANGGGAPRKVYEHKYVGALGQWLPLPYLPQPGSRPDVYGVGVCVLARCVCLPADLGGLLRRKSRAAGAGGEQKAAGAGCLRFRGGKSATLNVVAVPTIALFAMWLWPSNWALLSGHAALSLANLHRGRLWVLISAPFAHRSWGEVFRTGLLLATTVDSMDRAGASCAVLLLLHLAGCWAAWLARAVLWRRLVVGDASAYYRQEWGAAGGLAAQLVFLARARPEDRFGFSFYMVPVPVELSAWQSLFAHTLVDLGSGGVAGRDWPGELLGQLASWAAGWLIHDAWALHT